MLIWWLFENPVTFAIVILFPPVPQFTAMFDQDEYQSLININSPTETDLLTAFFIINSSVTIGYLSFDIVNNMMVGESVSGSDFLINGTTPPIVIFPPFESMYQLTISTGREFTAGDQMRDNITFNLHSFVNTTNGDIIMALASVVLHVTGNCSIINICKYYVYVC